MGDCFTNFKDKDCDHWSWTSKEMLESYKAITRCQTLRVTFSLIREEITSILAVSCLDIWGYIVSNSISNNILESSCKRWQRCCTHVHTVRQAAVTKERTLHAEWFSFLSTHTSWLLVYCWIVYRMGQKNNVNNR